MISFNFCLSSRVARVLRVLILLLDSTLNKKKYFRGDLGGKIIIWSSLHYGWR